MKNEEKADQNKNPKADETGKEPEQNEQKNPIPQENPLQPENDKLAPGDEKVVLVVDLEEQKIHAFKNDKETVPFDKDNENEFLRIDKSSILENFVSNLSRQYEDPKRFKVMALPIKFMEAIGKTIDYLFRLQPPQNVIDFYDKHTINDPELKAKQQQKNTGDNSEKKYHVFDDGMINWDQIKKELGISREYLASKGYLDPLLRGGKTPEAVPININLGFAKIRGTARLSLRKNASGVPYMDAVTPRLNPDFTTYYGHKFTKEDEKQLLEKGVMGRSVFLNGRDGEKVKSILGLDPATNEIIAVRAEKVFIPDEKCGVKLTHREKEILREGGEVRLENMKSSKSNTEFPGTLYISPLTHRVEIRFDSQDLFERKTLGGKKLSDAELERLKAGDAVKIENMITKNGDPFSRFVKIIDGKPEYFKFNPDAPEENREVIIPTHISGKEVPAEEFPRFAAGDPIFMEGMYKANGDKMDRYVQLDLDTGEVRYAVHLEDLHKTLDETMEKKEYVLPDEQSGHKFKPSEHADLRAGKTIKIEDMVGANGLPLGTRWLNADQKTGYLNYHTQDPDAPKQKNTVEKAQKQEQGKSRGVA